MPQSLARIYVHVVFGTKHRIPWLVDKIRPELFAFMAGSLNQMGSNPVCIAGVSDHAHLLFRLSKSHALSRVVERVKTDSSVWLKTQGGNFEDFSWQNGYGAFSVDESSLEVVTKYVSSQELHHQRLSFKDEARRIFIAHKLEYDEKYFWD